MLAWAFFVLLEVITALQQGKCFHFLQIKSVRRCDISARENVLRHGPIYSFSAHDETHWDVAYLRTQREKTRFSNSKPWSLCNISRQDDLDKQRCPQWKIALGTVIFSYFFFVVKSASCEYQAVWFSQSEVEIRALCRLIFIRDCVKASLNSSNWWAKKFSNKALFWNI
jgi:hypothetical protein